MYVKGYLSNRLKPIIELLILLLYYIRKAYKYS